MSEESIVHDTFPSPGKFDKAAERQNKLTTDEFNSLRSRSVISKGRGGRRYLPYAFTEHGVIMAANVLNSERAAQTSVEIVRAFVRLRQILASNAGLSRRLDDLERKYDHQFKAVFDAIRQLMSSPTPKDKQIGFRSREQNRAP